MVLNELTIEVRGLIRKFGDVKAIDGLDFSVRRGECVGLLGPNGAGKTTTVEILHGMQVQDGGEVRVFGRTWERDSRWLRERIGVCPQETRLIDLLTVKETVELFSSFYPRVIPVAEALGLVQLEHLAKSRVGTLSGGQRQRLSLALAFVGSPDLLFLDEPTTGLDPQSRRLVWDAVRERQKSGCTVVLTTHFMEEAEALCGRLVIMDHGRVIAEGAPTDMVNSHLVEQFIELEVRPELPVEALQDLEGVTMVSGRGPRLLIGVRSLALVLPRVINLLQERGSELLHLSTRPATLDDVFIELTGRSLREEKAA